MVVVVRRAQLLLLLVAALSAAAVAHAHAHAQHGEGVRGRGGTLRGSVACLDCSPGHDLSGVVVAVRCGGGGAGQLRAAQTDERGGFDVAVPAGGDDGRSHPRCAARILGGAEQLCAPGGLAVAPVVAAAGREPGSYALASSLAVFTRCGALASTAGATGNEQSPAPPRARRTTPRQAPATSSPRRAGRAIPPAPYAGPGLPLIYFFPFLPIIGIP